MQTNHLSIEGQTIAYTASSGEGFAALLIHGNSSSRRAYQRQLDSELGRTHKLVAIDMPGFGDSQPVADPEKHLGVANWGRLVVKVAEALNLGELALVGWSLGGHVALEAAEDLPGCKGVLIFGTPPFAFPPDMEAGFFPHPAMSAAFTADLSEADMKAFHDVFFAPGYDPGDTRFIEDLRRADGRARAAVAGSIRPGGYKDEVEVVRNLRVPLAVLHGAEEQVVRLSYFDAISMPTLWRGAVQVIPGAGHAPQWETPEVFNSLLGEFLADCAAQQ
ncbi:alpha/beta fold hydrolase [Caldilinea sp.]|uniref:alpha/beta fold hydrolase n=1 Tax=Caldilinea sp. TaxID=2293560 RepID=UPI0021DC6DB6|nr:alpha/beta hydrolase [Caldilinea sp.]GIV69464.1 MAG: alpha/beta hydrolase [Caldilinea sp.]